MQWPRFCLWIMQQCKGPFFQFVFFHQFFGVDACADSSVPATCTKVMFVPVQVNCLRLAADSRMSKSAVKTKAPVSCITDYFVNGESSAPASPTPSVSSASSTGGSS